jgi:hypothetical protein
MGLIFAGLVLAATGSASETVLGAAPPLLRIAGGYLAYSFDHDQILGENVSFVWSGWAITASSIKFDVRTHGLVVYGGVVLTKGAEHIEADEFYCDADKAPGILIRYGQTIETTPFTGTRTAEELAVEARTRRSALNEVTWAKLRASLLYSTAKTIEITALFEVYGEEVTLYVEGLESVGFKRFKLSAGDASKTGGLSLDKVWFTRNQGLFGDLSYAYRRDKKIQSLTRFHYEEHSILKDYIGLPRQLDLQTSTTWSVNDRLDLGVAGNYNSTSLWNTRLFLGTRGRDAKKSTVFDISTNKPLQSRGEIWLGLQSDLASEKWGTLAFQGRYELHDQALINLNYVKTFGRRVQFQWNSNYSHIRFGGAGGGASKILTAGLNLSYNADRFQAAADYYLNNDLLGEQRLTRPQLRLGLTPLTFYGGLLTAALSNVFVVNSLRTDRSQTESYNNNTSFNLSALPIRLRPGLTLQAGLTAEQFVEKEGRNFTSGGTVLKALQEFAPGIALEAIYSAQSRRRTRGWLIEGTTSQDLSVVFRAHSPSRVNGWVSLSYDPKYGDWKSGFADLSVGLIKNWKIQSLLNYDFFAGRLANIDLYLIRRAGRFDLRFIWRSLSRQFLVELVPSR